MTTAQSTITWSVIDHEPQLEKKTSKTENPEWGLNAAQSMVELTRTFPVELDKGKSTLGDLFDKTPMDLISKVMLEEKIFETWYHGRTVLIGDGKKGPSSFQTFSI